MQCCILYLSFWCSISVFVIVALYFCICQCSSVFCICSDTSCGSPTSIHQKLQQALQSPPLYYYPIHCNIILYCYITLLYCYITLHYSTILLHYIVSVSYSEVLPLYSTVSPVYIIKVHCYVIAGPSNFLPCIQRVGGPLHLYSPSGL